MNIPGYRIEKKLGSGGAATVYLAEQISLKRKVALKVMTPPEKSVELFKQRFKKEALLIAQLKHENIVTIYDIGDAYGVLYIAMEYIPGGNLLDRVTKRISLEDALGILAQICSALQFLHENKIVHRDVKPENILLDGEKAYLSDLGIAKDLSSNTRLTSEGHYLGTAYYMSPEQASAEEVDYRSDVYSLGAVFYEMLTGKVPYAATDHLKIVMQHLSSPIPQLPEPVAHFQHVIDTAMAKDRDERYQSIADFLDEVMRVTSSCDTTLRLPLKRPLRDKGSVYASAKGGGQRFGLIHAGAALLAIGAVIGLPLAFGLLGDTPSQDSPLKAQPAERAVALKEDPLGSKGPAKSEMPVQLEVPIQSVKSLESKIPAEPNMPLSVEEQIKLLDEAENHMINSRLTQPPGNNALENYRLVLKANPSHRGAQQGIQSIADYYYNAAQASLQAGLVQRANDLVRMGLTVLPEYQNLKNLEQELQRAQSEQ